MASCYNHPLRRALYECRKCGLPICDECMAENSRFCSTQCAREFQEFQSRVVDAPVSRRKKFSVLGCLKSFILSIVLIIVIWFALQQLLGTSNPGQMVVEFKKIWRLAF